MTVKMIGGLDEVGYGCIAGPCVVAFAAFPETAIRIPGVRDSKQISSRTERQKLYLEVLRQAEVASFGYATAQFISEQGLAKGWQAAAMMALERAHAAELPNLTLVVDGDRHVADFPRHSQLVLPKADVTHWQVSAASILAKEVRDMAMEELAKTYPVYCWDSNMGYGTKDHMAALDEHGPSPFHRKIKRKRKRQEVSKFSRRS